LNFYSDLTIPLSDGTKKEIGKIDYILNIASESHVDNSITNPVSFIQNNINLMLNILEYAREVKPERFIHFSSDEVYGTADDIDYKEGDRFNPGNPYSASKAAQECICYAYSNTYKLPIQITNCMNILGERQHKEKFLPLCINSIINDNELYIHSNPEKTKAGSRFYIHARNVADAILFILKNVNETLNHIDASKGKFHIVGEKEIDNLELAKLIEKYVRMIPKYKNHTLKYEMVDFHSSRPGHDLRYAMSGEKMKSLG
jgi:dTDP-glucose 4,6-dehydratase